RQPRAQLFELQKLRARRDQRLHFRVEDGRQRLGQLTGVLVVVEVDVPGQIHGPGADRDLEWPARVRRGRCVQVGQPQRTRPDGAAVVDAAPVRQKLDLLGAVCRADGV